MMIVSDIWLKIGRARNSKIIKMLLIGRIDAISFNLFMIKHFRDIFIFYFDAK